MGAWDKLKKEFRDVVNKGVTPSSVKAFDEKNDVEKKAESGDQLQKDLKESPMERRIKFQKGFYSK